MHSFCLNDFFPFPTVQLQNKGNLNHLLLQLHIFFLDLDKKIPVLINLGISHFSTSSSSLNQFKVVRPSIHNLGLKNTTPTHAKNTMSFSAFNSMNIQVSMIDSWKGKSFLFVDFLKVTSIYGSESRRSSSTSDKITFNCCGTKNSNQKQVRNDFF